MSKIYAVIGTSSMTVVADSVKYTPATGEVLMQGERPEGDYVANEDGEWVEDKQKAIDALDAQYDRDKADIMNYYTQALFAGDEEEQEQLKAEMEEIDAQYVENRKALEEDD